MNRKLKREQRNARWRAHRKGWRLPDPRPSLDRLNDDSATRIAGSSLLAAGVVHAGLAIVAATAAPSRPPPAQQPVVVQWHAEPPAATEAAKPVVEEVPKPAVKEAPPARVVKAAPKRLPKRRVKAAPEPTQAKPPVAALTKPAVAAPTKPAVAAPTKPAVAAPLRRTPRVVGLSLESTVAGGRGPAFAVGGTRDGATARTAQAPRAAAPTQVAPRKRNRRARVRPSDSGSGSGSGTLVIPRRRRRIEPDYPEAYRARGIEGAVTVELVITPVGRVREVRLLTASKHAGLNDSARRAALTERFDPARLDGVPVEYTLSFTYRFQLNG